MIIRGIGSVFLFCCFSYLAIGQSRDSIVLSYSFSTQAQEIYADPLGSFYLLQDKRSIEKYSSTGQLLFRYSNNRLGDIGWMDVNDPFHLQLYFPDYRKLVLLDNDLGELESYDLMAMGLYDHPGIGISFDNNFWLFDNNSGRMKKINKHGETLLESDNIFYALSKTPQPTRVVETKKYVLLVDKEQGIFIFDQFGKYIKPLKQKIPVQFQIWNNRIIFFEDNSLHFIGLNDGRIHSIATPVKSEIIYAQFSTDQIYTLDDGKVNIYQLKKKSKSDQ